jgi:hypothetical protein
MGIRRGIIAFVLSMGLITVWAAPADAVSTRAEYVAQVEPICKQAYDQFIAGTRKLNKVKPRLGLLPTLVKLSALYRRTLDPSLVQLSAVPPAPGDEEVIAQWLKLQWVFADDWHGIGRAAKHRKGRRALALLSRAGPDITQANELVADFGFQYCVA